MTLSVIIKTYFLNFLRFLFFLRFVKHCSVKIIWKYFSTFLFCIHTARYHMIWARCEVGVGEKLTSRACCGRSTKQGRFLKGGEGHLWQPCSPAPPLALTDQSHFVSAPPPLAVTSLQRIPTALPMQDSLRRVDPPWNLIRVTRLWTSLDASWVNASWKRSILSLWKWSACQPRTGG